MAGTMKCLLVIMIFVFSGDYVFGANTTTGTISVEVKNLPDGVSFQLSRAKKSGMGADSLETVRSQNGLVRFKTELAVDGNLYFIIISDKSKANIPENIRPWIRVFMDSPKVTVKGDMKKWPEVEFEGSKASPVYENYQKLQAPLLKGLNDAAAKIKNKEIADSNEIKPLLRDYRMFVMNYIRQNLTAASAPLLISQSIILTLDDKKQLMSEIDEMTRKSFYGKQLDRDLKKISIIESSSIRIDAPLVDFKMETLDGNLVSVKQLIAKSEYTLIDFWASWCLPCKENVPYLKEIYAKYHDKGFNVVAISIDSQRKAWEKSLRELDVRWDNVIDQENIAKPLFSIKAIPAYVLLNRNAEIIAMEVIGNKNNGASARYFVSTEKKDLSGDSLTKILEGLFDKKDD